MGVKCDEVRESISALVDGESPPLPVDVVERHVEGCVKCRQWRRDAEVVRRQLRLTAAPALTDLTGRVMAAVQADVSSQAAGRRSEVSVRFGLVLVALAQLFLAAPVLLFGHDHSAPEHLAHELGSFTTAVAFGLLIAALRPRLAAGMAPLVGTVASLLVITAAIDLSLGYTDLSDEAPHLLEVAGFLLLLRLARMTGGRRSVPMLRARVRGPLRQH